MSGSASNRQNVTAEDLRKFEAKIAATYNEGKIRAPVHLANGSESELIQIFREIGEKDYVLSTWRSHYHALLHGVPEERVEASVLAGHSISLSFPGHRFFSSGIVGGMLSIGVGIAEGLKRRKTEARVWVFIGDMAANTGIAFSSLRLAIARDLPLNFVVENNGLSVCTPTEAIWPQGVTDLELIGGERVRTYHYRSKFPHAGAGKRIQF